MEYGDICCRGYQIYFTTGFSVQSFFLFLIPDQTFFGFHQKITVAKYCQIRWQKIAKYSSTDKRRVDNRTDRFKVKAFIKLSTDLKTKFLFFKHTV